MTLCSLNGVSQSVEARLEAAATDLRMGGACAGHMRMIEGFWMILAMKTGGNFSTGGAVLADA